MSIKPTPGPWYTSGVHVQSAVINEDNYVCRAEGNTPEQAEANARLIAAAPALLEALKAMHSVHRAFSSSELWTVLDDDARTQAETVIALLENEKEN